MKQVLTILLLTGFSSKLLARSEIGPEGDKLLWFLISVAMIVLSAVFFLKRDKGKSGSRFARPVRHKVIVELKKDRLYYPRFVELSVTNKGNSDIDINTPLLLLSSIWVTRKFKLRGTNNNWFYPLFLMKNQNHTLNIDLHRFYGFDRTLKRLPRMKVVVSDIKGRRLGSSKILLRKTLFNF